MLLSSHHKCHDEKFIVDFTHDFVLLQQSTAADKSSSRQQRRKQEDDYFCSFPSTLFNFLQASSHLGMPLPLVDEQQRLRPLLAVAAAAETEEASSDCSSLAHHSNSLQKKNNFCLHSKKEEKRQRRKRRSSSNSGNSSRNCSNTYCTFDSRKNRRRTPFALFSLLLFIIALLGNLPLRTECATFFYGATEDSESAASGSSSRVVEPAQLQIIANAAAATAASSNEQQQQALSSSIAENERNYGGGAMENEEGEEEVEEEEEEPKLSSQELESVFKFCSLLPMLEEAGQIVKNRQARQVCDKLVDMLKPMFRKRNRPPTIRARRTMLEAATKRRRRR